MGGGMVHYERENQKLTWQDIFNSQGNWKLETHKKMWIKHIKTTIKTLNILIDTRLEVLKTYKFRIQKEQNNNCK